MSAMDANADQFDELNTLFRWALVLLALGTTGYIFLAGKSIYLAWFAKLIERSDEESARDALALFSAGVCAVLATVVLLFRRDVLLWLIVVVPIAMALFFMVYRGKQSAEWRLQNQEQSREAQLQTAERSGSLARVLRTYDAHHEQAHIITVLNERLPPWSIRSSLLQTVEQLFALRRGLTAARDRGLSPAVTEATLVEAQRIAEALWETADDLVATGHQDIWPAREGIVQEDPNRCVTCGETRRAAGRFCITCGTPFSERQTAGASTPNYVPGQGMMMSERLQDNLDRQQSNLLQVMRGMQEIREGLALSLTAGNASNYLESVQGTLDHLAAMTEGLE